MVIAHARLSQDQAALLARWLPDAEVLRDHSWGLVGTVVLEVRSPDGACYVVKAGDARDHHVAREVTAHRQWLGPWTSDGSVGRLLAADTGAKVLVADWLAGDLVEGTPHEHAADTYGQAGALLRRLHRQPHGEDDGAFERRQRDETLEWLARPHRIPPRVVEEVRREVAGWPTPPSALTPTHGDWQPRNWLWHEGRVHVIDLGRAALRPPHTDLARLAMKQLRSGGPLADAFFAGYGADPRGEDAWRRTLVREAAGAAGWSHQVGDTAFEELGLSVLADLTGLGD